MVAAQAVDRPTAHKLSPDIASDQKTPVACSTRTGAMAVAFTVGIGQSIGTPSGSIRGSITLVIMSWPIWF
jgi:hypothetical protein